MGVDTTTPMKSARTILGNAYFTARPNPAIPCIVLMSALSRTRIRAPHRRPRTMDATRRLPGWLAAAAPVWGSTTTRTALRRANIMDSAATNAVPSMTRPSPIKVFRSDRACLRTSGSAPPRIERKLDIQLTTDLTFLIGDTVTKRAVLINLQTISLACTDGTPGRTRPRGSRAGQLQHQENIHAHRKISPWVQGLRIMVSADRQSRGAPLRAEQR